VALHDELVPCAGILDVLATLAEEGRSLGIVTSKRRETVSLAFARIPALDAYFDVVVAAEDVTRHKPNPDALVAALERLSASPESTAYVGDSPVDVQAAKAVPVASIAVTWGKVHDRRRLEREEPDAIVDSPEELLGAL
jgi:pyrophosphatase PpaX